MTVLFRSKVDGKFKVVGLAMPCVALIGIVAGPRAAVVLWVPALAALAAAVLVSWVVLSTYYEFEAKDLVVHAGPLSWRVPLNQISSVSESNSLRSGPALSLDRLAITYRGGRVMLISPEDKAGFLAALHRRAPQLKS
jgi:Bacterial PH domain